MFQPQKMVQDISLSNGRCRCVATFRFAPPGSISNSLCVTIVVLYLPDARRYVTLQSVPSNVNISYETLDVFCTHAVEQARFIVRGSN